MCEDTEVFSHIVSEKYEKQVDGIEKAYVTLDGIMPAIYWPLEKHGKFLQLCAKDFAAGKSLFFSEYAAPDRLNMFMDIDFTVDHKHSDSLTGVPFNKMICKLIRVAQRSAVDMFEFLVEAETSLSVENKRLLLVVIQRRKLPKVKHNQEQISAGFHLHWPNLVVTLEGALAIRSRMLWYADSLSKLPDLDDRQFKPPTEAEGWADIIDEGVYKGNAHLRSGLSEKCKPCDCTINVCPHGRTHRTNVPGSAYNRVVGVFDHQCKPQLHEGARLQPLDEQGQLRPDAILSFLEATTIRTADEPYHHVAPANFIHGFGVTVDKKKRKRGGVKQAGDIDESEEKGRNQMTRIETVYRWIQCTFGLIGQLAPISEMAYEVKPGKEYYSITTTSRYCSNAGQNHTSSNGQVTVCLIFS